MQLSSERRENLAVLLVCASQEAEERHRQALWADEGTNGASFMEEDEQDEGGKLIGNEDLLGLPAWRLVLRRLVDHNKFQVREQPHTSNTYGHIRRQVSSGRREIELLYDFIFVRLSRTKEPAEEKRTTTSTSPLANTQSAAERKVQDTDRLSEPFAGKEHRFMT